MARVPGASFPRTVEQNQVACGAIRRPAEPAGQGGRGPMRSIEVRPVSDAPRPRYHFVRRLIEAVLRWTFIVIGALATATVLFAYLYRVNETIYDPSMFA